MKPGEVRFSSGVPLNTERPHGGMQLSWLVCHVNAGATTIRDVIAFPKTTRGTCLLTGAPSAVKPEQRIGFIEDAEEKFCSQESRRGIEN